MKRNLIGRRKFFKTLGAGSAVIAANPFIAAAPAKIQEQAKPATNISETSKYPRKPYSMPGKYPGKVVVVKNERSVVDDVPVEEVAYLMLSRSMLELTGQKRLDKAWRLFVSPGEKIGLKVNPVAGKLLSTSHAVVKSVVKQLTECGIDRKDIIIWDRRDMELKDTGFVSENYPGITIKGTEMQDEKGSFTDENGILYGERNIDREWYYWADVDGEYDAETMPYMVNGGKFSYFGRIVTKEIDKIINIPILKNAGGSITNAMKNLAFGSISNTGRLHAQLWNETCAEVCAFPPIRDKVVLNISDGLRGCFNGGPGANPQFICNYNSLLVATDPVALDRIGYDIIAAKRIAEGLQKTPVPESLTFLKMAADLGLGVYEKDKIDLKEIEMS
ncbi:MAG: DUF362 domain-containing protein [Bacteroidales bacterium]|jgi:uncharacterized protein (DUF362 family)|nr:DUF362 domain-containing protein [Bacteroidales bacterium]